MQFTTIKKISCERYVYILRGENKLQTIDCSHFAYNRMLVNMFLDTALSAWRAHFTGEIGIHARWSNEEWPHA